jgi:hypothetical protein
MIDEIGVKVHPLCIARSRSNQRRFFLLLITICIVFIFFSFFSYNLAIVITLVLAYAAIWQCLRTYTFRTVFLDDRIEHSTMLGVWHGIEYNKIIVSADRDESITIIGEDVMGEAIRIQLLKSDGNLKEALELLCRKTSGRMTRP